MSDYPLPAPDERKPAPVDSPRCYEHGGPQWTRDCGLCRSRAIRVVLGVLRNPLLLLGPARHEAVELAERHSLTAVDLIQAARDRALKA